jgi:hypothetical protein
MQILHINEQIPVRNNLNSKGVNSPAGSLPMCSTNVLFFFFYSTYLLGAGVAQWLTTDWTPGFYPRQRQRIFLLTSASRPELGPTQPPVQWVLGVLSPWAKSGRGVMLTTHPHLVPRLRMSKGYTSSPPQAPPRRVAGQFYFFFLLLCCNFAVCCYFTWRIHLTPLEDIYKLKNVWMGGVEEGIKLSMKCFASISRPLRSGTVLRPHGWTKIGI